MKRNEVNKAFVEHKPNPIHHGDGDGYAAVDLTPPAYPDQSQCLGTPEFQQTCNDSGIPKRGIHIVLRGRRVA